MLENNEWTIFFHPICSGLGGGKSGTCVALYGDEQRKKFGGENSNLEGGNKSPFAAGCNLGAVENILRVAGGKGILVKHTKKET